MIPEHLRCLYLHGFKSGPQSSKAQQTQMFFELYQDQQNLHIPQLPPDPQAAMDHAQFIYEQLLDEVGPASTLVIGSSLGGYFASYLVERFGGRCALINPAVKPYELLRDYLGENENLYNGERFIVTEDYMEELKALDTPALVQPQRHFLMVQTHDETLDYRLACDKYRNGPCIIEYGGDHSYSHFQQRLPAVMSFMQMPY